MRHTVAQKPLSYTFNMFFKGLRYSFDLPPNTQSPAALAASVVPVKLQPTTDATLARAARDSVVGDESKENL